MYLKPVQEQLQEMAIKVICGMLTKREKFQGGQQAILAPAIRHV